MTTEIVVLNRAGVALAADSAVTISNGTSTKIFNTADKLFELCTLEPIAMMVNGNMDLFGVPWDLIIKDFRSKHGHDKERSVSEWATLFVNFTNGREDVVNIVQDHYLKYIVTTQLTPIARRIVERLLDQNGLPKRGKLEKNLLAKHIIQEKISEIQLLPVVFSLQDVDFNELKQAIEITIETELRQMPLVLRSFFNEELFPDLKNLMAEIVYRVIPGEMSTGLIVAGYGPGNHYPEVVSVDVDGFVCGRLRYSDIKMRATIESPSIGHVVSFAQTDVIDRLLEGADPRFVNETTEYLVQISRQLAEDIVQELFPTAGTKRRAELRGKVDRMLGSIAQIFSTKTAEGFRSHFRDEYQQMIAVMPRLELIELAEALVSITAIERKATADEGTVGGPIDVAFLTRHEGFVWIKRKHYFQANLNPRFFWRKYGVHNVVGESRK